METLENPRRILFIQTAFLGDAILSLPAIESLKNKFPDYQIDVLCNPNTAEVFKHSPFIDEVLVFDKRKTNKSLLSLFRFANFLKKKKYTRIYSAHRSFRTSLLVLLTEVKETYGFSIASFNFVYKNLVEYVGEDHEVKKNLDLVNYPEKVEKWKVLPNVKVPNEVKLKISNLLDSFNNEDRIAIAPGSIWFTKRYPAEKFRFLTEKLSERGYYIFLIGSKDDKELCESIKNHSDKVINFAGEFSFIETVEFLKNCKLLISNDSAPTHIGMCADIPVITIYCSTIPEFGFYPYNNLSTSISLDELNCKPCGIHGYKECPLGHFKCANDLNEKIIFTKAIEILRGN